MQAYYCQKCIRYIPTNVCPAHPGVKTVRIESNPAKRPEPPSHGSETSPSHQASPGSLPESLQGEHFRPTVDREVIPPKLPLNPLHMISAPAKKSGTRAGNNILRFRKSERMLHWAIAIPFVVCWSSAVVLVLVYNPDPLRPLRDLFAVVHRASGIALIVFPAFVMLRNRKDYAVHLYNVKSAWLWSLNDLKWLALMGLAAISKRIVLPEQGKFNAAEKVNFMSVMVACPIFIVTGIMIWTQTVAWAAWLVHGLLALFVSPTMLGHIYMATVNPDTRSGISGMISGYVDRQWARHHYGLWYKEQFENNVERGSDGRAMIHPPDHRVRIHCPSCGENITVTWGWLLQRILSAKKLFCPNCGSSFAAIQTVTNKEELDWIKRQYETGRITSSPAA